MSRVVETHILLEKRILSFCTSKKSQKEIKLPKHKSKFQNKTINQGISTNRIDIKL